MPRLEDWAISPDWTNPYCAPECRETIMGGKIYNDDRFEDGKQIATSKFVGLDLEKMQAQTRNTLYDLGEPNKEWMEKLKEKGMTLEDIARKCPVCKGGTC